jgi:hypothetical protein
MEMNDRDKLISQLIDQYRAELAVLTNDELQAHNATLKAHAALPDQQQAAIGEQIYKGVYRE